MKVVIVPISSGRKSLVRICFRSTGSSFKAIAPKLGSTSSTLVSLYMHSKHLRTRTLTLLVPLLFEWCALAETGWMMGVGMTSEMLFWGETGLNACDGKATCTIVLL